MTTLTSVLTSPVRYVAPNIDTYRIELENQSDSVFRRYDITVTSNLSTDPNPSAADGRLWAYSCNIDTGSFNEDTSTFFVATGGVVTDVQVHWDDLTVLGLGDSNTP